MTTKRKIVTIFGGTGFIGRHVVKRLAAEGYTIKVATRIPEQANYLKTCGAVGQVVPVLCDYQDKDSLRRMISGCDFVVNCIGILFQKRNNKFRRLHEELPTQIAALCSEESVGRFVHISALGADQGKSRYAASKLAGERMIMGVCPWATILRPSVVFGPEDNFFNMFARMARIVPVLPLIGGGKTKFQPVYVGDVANAVMAALLMPAVGEADPRGKIYELGGPEIVSFREVYELLFQYTGRRRPLVPLPFFVAKIDAAFLSLMPTPLLTPDQVESLKTDNLVSRSSLTMAALGLTSTGMGMILPGYLETYKSGGRFADKKTA